MKYTVSELKNRFRTVRSAAGKDAEIPVFDAFLLEMGDDECVCVRGSRGITAYSTESISLRTDKFSVTFEGKNLYIKQYSEDSAVIGGCIAGIRFGRDDVDG